MSWRVVFVVWSFGIPTILYTPGVSVKSIHGLHAASKFSSLVRGFKRKRTELQASVYSHGHLKLPPQEIAGLIKGLLSRVLLPTIVPQ